MEEMRISTMDCRTVDGTLDFLFTRLVETRARSLIVGFSGGEPFCNPQLIEDLAEPMYSLAGKIGVDFRLTCTTNGTILDRPMIGRLERIGLRRLNVSIAVSQKLHNKYRVGRDGRGTYSKIMANLASLRGMQTPITVLCQYPTNNRTDCLDVGQMLDDLVCSGAPVDKVLFSPILPTRCNATDSVPCSGPQDYEVFLYLEHQAEQRGFRQFSLDEPPGSSCGASMRYQYTIGPSGKVSACPAVLDMVIGDVHKGIDFAREAALLNRKLPDRCLNECPLTPRCFGGCRWQAYVQTNDFGGVDCRYESLRRVIEAFMEKEARKAILSDKIEEEWFPAA